MATRAAVGFSRQSYILDKLHSLSGVIPIGAFLAEHFWSNSYALVSPEKYNQTSLELQGIPWRLIVEIFAIWLPILYHGVYGVYIWWVGKSNLSQHRWMSNWMYFLQRWTGIIAFVFIGWHLWTERFATHGMSDYAGVAANMQNVWYALFYVVGVVASSFHLGNGLWNFACKWGIAVTARSQKWAAIFGAAVGIIFTFVGLMIVAGFYYNWHPLNGYIGQ